MTLSWRTRVVFVGALKGLSGFEMGQTQVESTHDSRQVDPELNQDLGLSGEICKDDVCWGYFL